MAKTEVFRDRWALVTGASSGIGRELARELARRGAKLILTARRQERLEALAAELNANGTETRTIAADLNDPEAPQRIHDATEGSGIEVDVLVNNAGLGQFGAFISSEVRQELSQVRVNCEAVVHLSRLFVPHMVKRRRGWVLVTASTAGYQPIPYCNTYAATKAFDRFFALGMAAEVEPFGVEVTALCPGTTETEFFDAAHANAPKGQAAPEVARRALDALARGRRIVIPNMKNRIRATLVQFAPVRAVTRAIRKFASPR